MHYCSKCLMPNTRPGIKFDENNVCTGCKTFENQNSIDWDIRWKELEQLCDIHRGCNGNNYDCIIAVSGGKDSHFQTYIIKEKMKMNPLLVTAGNIDWTETGRKNLDNISDAFGCDVIMFNPNQHVARIMLKKGLEEFGSPSWYQDALLYSFPIQMAMKFGIKLVIYGEDVNYTYGGKHDTETSSALLQSSNSVVKPEWDIWFKDGQLSEKDLQSAKQPDINEVKEFGLEPTYLSYFVPWNSIHNYEVAKRFGFRHLGHEYEREGSIDNFDQIDSLSYMLNPFLKYLKYGHAVATDNASRWIRYGKNTIFDDKGIR